MRLLLFFSFSLFISACSHINNENSNSKLTDSTLHQNLNNINNYVIDTNSQTFFYDPSISTIIGVICKKAVYEVLHENDREPRDTIIVVALKKHISVVHAPNADTANFDEVFPNEYNVDTIQLTIPSSSSRHGLDKSIGHIARLKGTLYHSDNGSEFTNVLLYVEEIQDSKDSTVLRFK